MRWYKSTRSGMTSNCVEIAVDADARTIHIRDSKDPNGSILSFDRRDFSAFVADVKLGRFTHRRCR
jgi:hypothetical protein